MGLRGWPWTKGLEPTQTFLSSGSLPSSSPGCPREPRMVQTHHLLHYLLQPMSDTKEETKGSQSRAYQGKHCLLYFMK